VREGRRASPQEGAPSCPLLTALLALCLALAPEAPRRRACSSPPLRGPGEPAASSKPHRSRAGHASRHAAEPTSGAGAGPPTAPELSAPPPSATPPVTVTAPLELEKVAFAADELEMWLDSSSAAGTRLAVESPILTPSVREAATSAWQAVVSVVTGRACRSGRCCSPGIQGDACASRQSVASAALNGCRAFVDVARPLPWRVGLVPRNHSSACLPPPKLVRQRWHYLGVTPPKRVPRAFAARVAEPRRARRSPLTAPFLS
jgi:hypothetical protein